MSLPSVGLFTTIPTEPVIKRGGIHTEAHLCPMFAHELQPSEELAECAICDQLGCVDCLDSHNCLEEE